MIYRQLPDLDHDILSFLQSTTAELLYRDLADLDPNRWQDSRILEALQRKQNNDQIDEGQKSFVNHYLQRRLPHQGSVYAKRSLKVLSLVKAQHGHFCEHITHLIVDEAGVVREGQLLALCTAFLYLSKYSLRETVISYHPNMVRVPPPTIKYAMRGILDSIHERQAISIFSLDVSYMSHTSSPNVYQRQHMILDSLQVSCPLIAPN